jgi:Na+/H+ antiporter NhaD/arsenite permease-like protein
METLPITVPMIVSGVILAVTLLAIFTEQIHGMERSKVAPAGAVAMVIAGQIFGFYSPVQAVEAVDWNVIFLLGAMMTIVSIMIPTGGFNWLAYRLAAMSKGNLYLMLVLLGTAVTVLSLLLDNVTIVVIFGPLIIMIAQAQKVSPVPYLLAAALLSDAGGVGTLVGDPPNLMIGSAAGIDFNTFLMRMGGIVFVAWVSILIGLKFLFRRELAVTPRGVLNGHVDIQDKRTWRVSLIILGLGMTMLIFSSGRILMDRAMEHVEITLLMFFIGLFMVIGGVEESRFLDYLGQFITPFVEQDLLAATIVLMWFSAFLSAAIDNIPFTAAMIPIILGMEAQGINVTPLWWGLAMGVGLGGNGTHIGSTANVFIVTISERLAREQNDASLAITPSIWFKKGTPMMLLSLIVATVVFALFFDYFARPLR